MEETALPVYFGEWLKCRRRELDLTQTELAQRAGCSVPALRKIEAGERRPSKQLAELLAKSVDILPDDQTNFIRVARGELNIERLYSLGARKDHQAQRLVQFPWVLPGRLTAFIGREPEMAAIGQLLSDPYCRMLTLVGAGGIGKTRLAIEVAAQHTALFPDGICYVPLAPLNSAEYLVPAIIDALKLSLQDVTQPRQQLLNFLHGKKALLVLDNVEHLLDGAGLFADILNSASQIKLLATSRERMNLHSEWVFEIQGLPVPPSSQGESFEVYSSVALFLQNARRVQPSFTVRDEEKPWVIRICQIMDGMPLGIELAAAWVGLLSCEEIAREIDRNLDFLTVALRDFPERHRSLRATLDYSWRLLNPDEKVILSRLSVFPGSFNREAAQEICGASLTGLSSLKDKSLLRRTEHGRFDLHELIRQYSAQRLAENASEDERLNDKHAAYFAQRLSEWEKTLKSSQQTEILLEMAHEIDNLRQAWQRMTSCCDLESQKNTLFNLDLFQNSLFSLSLFYELRCRNWEAIILLGEAITRLKDAQDALIRSEGRQRYETILGHITAYLGLHNGYILQYAQARQILEEAIRLLDGCDAKVEKAQAQIMLAWIYLIQGTIHKSISLLETNLVILKDTDQPWWYALTLAHLARAYLVSGKIHEGQSLFQEGLRLAEPGDLRLSVQLRNGLAYAYYLQNEYARAEQMLNENLELCTQLGNKRQTADVHMDLGQVALATNQLELAESHLQECVDILSELGESHDLAMGLVHLGKCQAARQQTQAARKNFLHVIRIGKLLDIFHLVYWGLINLSKINLAEGQAEKALQMALILQRYSVESKLIQADAERLWEEIKTRFSPQQIDSALSQVKDQGIELLQAENEG